MCALVTGVQTGALPILFERLPPVPASNRAAAADRWLREVGQIADPDERDALAATVLAVLDDPRFAALFGPDALAEAPVTAVIGDGLVVAGTIDRLLVPRSEEHTSELQSLMRISYAGLCL